MKKYIYILIGFIATLLIWCLIPKSCSKKLDNLERKSEKSLIIDSIISAQTEKHNAELDSIIHVKKKTDSIQKVEIQTLSKKYYALRAIVKTLDKVNIDSVNQVVNSIPIEAYNASINSGNMCDELLLDLNESSDRKDSIISMREIQNEGLKKVVDSKGQALIDQSNLNGELERQLKKSKFWNKVLVKIVVVETVILVAVALVI